SARRRLGGDLARLGRDRAGASQSRASAKGRQDRPLQAARRPRLVMANPLRRAAIDALMALDFLKDAGNAVVVGPNGVGKSTIARNIAHQAVLQGHTALFTSAGQLLGDLAAIDSASALRRRLSHYAAPALLVIDEVGYLSYSNRHADMLFELISRRYEAKSTLVTTNRPFSDWHEVFPGAACVVSLVDRLVHNADVIAIDGDSYRLKEAKERAEQRARQRRAPSS